jgi:hypothetical protein
VSQNSNQWSSFAPRPLHQPCPLLPDSKTKSSRLIASDCPKRASCGGGVRVYNPRAANRDPPQTNLHHTSREPPLPSTIPPAAARHGQVSNYGFHGWLHHPSRTCRHKAAVRVCAGGGWGRGRDASRNVSVQVYPPRQQAIESAYVYEYYWGPYSGRWCRGSLPIRQLLEDRHQQYVFLTVPLTQTDGADLLTMTENQISPSWRPER